MSPTFRHRTGSRNVGGNPRVGVLALQGDVREHTRLLQRLGADVVKVRRPDALSQVDGLILPGGESSVIDKLSRLSGIAESLSVAIHQGLPVYGTCAGMILLADRVVNAAPGQRTFGGIDMEVERNSFGAQSNSFDAEFAVPELGISQCRASFIRAPAAISVGPTVRTLSTVSDGRIVAVEQGALLATAFHPELTDEPRFHSRFLSTVTSRRWRRQSACTRQVS